MLVHGVGWLAGRFGYNIHARNFFAALSRHARVIETDLQEPAADRAVVQAKLEQALSRGETAASVALLYGSLAGVLDAEPGWRIAYTVWESTRLPDDWLAPLARADQIWIPTRWGRDVLIDNGLDPTRIRVVPEGVDPDLFHPSAVPAADIARRPGFKFLHVGKFEERKCTAQLLQAFDREFADTADVLLVVACDNPHRRGFSLADELRTLELRYPEKLVFIPPQRHHATLAGLYTACDAFLAPTRAEGWGLPILEAMACGLPTVVTGWSGPTAFADAETAYLLDYRLVPIELAFFERADGDLGLWAEPDFDQLRRTMRAIYRDPTAARARGRAAAERARCFSWAAAAEIAARELAALQEQPMPMRQG